jgi:Asp-tRNA(Asn)/Glu-tRNA(Gln) amidotransferase C subunit
MNHPGEPVRVTEADVDRVATLIGLVIAPEQRAAVAQHLAGLLDAIRMLEGIALPEATEPAPRFES